MLCLSDKSKNRNKSLVTDILNQTNKIIHGRIINADHNNTNGRVHVVISMYCFSFTLGTIGFNNDK